MGGRSRFRIPDSWHWPAGVSLSNEIGYQRPEFSADTWTWEIRPIVDKKIGRWFLSFNPTLDRSFHGPGVNQGVVFSSSFTFSYDITKRILAGWEYYGSWGPITDFSPLHDQQQQVFPAIDVDLGPEWEFNFGVGIGATASTDQLHYRKALFLNARPQINCLANRLRWRQRRRQRRNRYGHWRRTQQRV
jgi:hypothetical protein